MGPGAKCIYDLERANQRILDLRAHLTDLADRAERARNILTDGNPRPECNWGMLDTSAARAYLDKQQ